MNNRRKKILLVDDEKDVLHTLAEGLRASDGAFEVLTAENGRKALEIFRNDHKVDLLVTDIEMPVMDGFELLAHVKKDSPAIPVIVITGLITPKIKEQLKTIGDHICIEKPISFMDLRRKIIDELRLHSAQGRNQERPGQ